MVQLVGLMISQTQKKLGPALIIEILKQWEFDFDWSEALYLLMVS